MKKLAESLKLYAQNLGLTDADVARKTGLSEVRYGHYTRGRSEPDLATLLRICKVLNATPNDLLLRDDKTQTTARAKRQDELEVLRNRIAGGTIRLSKKQLQVIDKLLDAFLDG